MTPSSKPSRHADYSKSANRALTQLWTLAITIAIPCICYFGKEVIVPLALASLVAFLLIPVVSWLQKKIGIVTAVVSTMTLLIMVSVGISWMVAAQAIDLAEKLPDYKDNLHQKLQIFNLPKSKTMANLEATLLELRADLPGAKPKTDPATNDSSSTKSKKSAAPKEPEPMPVRIVEPSGGAKMLNFLGNIASPILGPLSDTAMVFLLATFMLLKHDDIRSRIFRLFSQGNIGKTSRVIDEAASKVRRYLLMQLVVNVSYGVPLGFGLYCLGVPNAFLWGALAAILRFIPYIGPWIAALFPVMLSLAVSPSWLTPLLVLTLFLLLELISNNVLEPWLYGSSTGVSSIALIVSAVFWTWLWGVPGLILATPLTVCLVVIGRHIPKLEVLTVLMGEEQALTHIDECYQRLARDGRSDEIRFTETYLKDKPLSSLYDEVLIPIMINMHQDLHQDNLNDHQYHKTFTALEELVEDLGQLHAHPPSTQTGTSSTHTESPNEAENPTLPSQGEPQPLIILAQTDNDRDQVGLQMVAHLIQREGTHIQHAPLSDIPTAADTICLTFVYPVKFRAIRRTLEKLAQTHPNARLGIGLLGYPEDHFEEDTDPLNLPPTTHLFTKANQLAQFINQ